MRATRFVLPMATVLVVGSSADAFSLFIAPFVTVQQQLEGAARWSSVTGLSDGIQVGVEASFAGTTRVEDRRSAQSCSSRRCATTTPGGETRCIRHWCRSRA